MIFHFEFLNYVSGIKGYIKDTNWLATKMASKLRKCELVNILHMSHDNLLFLLGFDGLPLLSMFFFARFFLLLFLDSST